MTEADAAAGALENGNSRMGEAEADLGTLDLGEEGETPSEGGAQEEVRQERVVVKFLVPNVAAGSIIGKAGANITEIQTHSSARMQLSKANEFYPGSSDGQDRVLLVSGTVNQLLTALHLVLAKLQSEPGALKAVQARDGEGALQLRMLVHSRLCGTLIGKGGATIRSFNEDSKAVFNISPPPLLPGLTERVVKITGEVEELMRAVALVVTKLSENPDYHLLTDANLTYGGLRSGGGGGGYGGGLHDTHSHRAPLIHQQTATTTIPIPEDKVGLVIGKQGQVINQIKDLLGVSIRISKKGEFLPGTTSRSCQISGTPESVEIAQRLVNQKIDAPGRG